jgi:peptidylprolyl isomerase
MKMSKQILVTALMLINMIAFGQQKSSSSNSSPAKPKERIVDIYTTAGVVRVKLYNETPLHRDNFIKLVKQQFYDSLLFHRVIKEFMIQTGDPTTKNAPDTIMLGWGDNGYTIPAEISKNIWHKRGALAMARTQNPEKASSGCQFYIVQGRKYSIKELETMINNINAQKKVQLFQKIMESDSVKNRMDDFTLRGDSEGLTKYMEQLQPAIDSIYEPMFFDPPPGYVSTYNMDGGTPLLDREYTVFGEVIGGMQIIDKIALEAVDKNFRPKENIRILKMVLLN